MPIDTTPIDDLKHDIVVGIPEHVREDFGDRIADLLEREEKLRGEHALEEFLATRIQQAYDRRQRGERPPLCSCRLPNCALKRGVIPPAIRVRGSGELQAIDKRQKAAEWMQDHPGNAAALRDALSDRDAELGRLYHDWDALRSEMIAEKWDRKLKTPESDTDAPGEEGGAEAPGD